MNNSHILNKIYSKVSKLPWLPGALALAGAGWYFIQLQQYAHSQASQLDEGAYLLKGLLFWLKVYQPFQPYGPWTNHMPLAFLIPGFFQRFFTPGMATGRAYAVGMALLGLLGLWLVTRRIGGRWWGALAVWAVAWNPAMSKMYSMAVSQVLISCLLVWMLVFVLGENRRLWQIALASLLASLMLLARINLFVVPPLLVLYVFWEHGKKAGVVALLSSGLTLLIGHALVWPDVLQMWAVILPPSLTPFLNAYRLPAEYARNWAPDFSVLGRFLSFFHSLRFHFAPFVGAITVWLLWPPKNAWRRQSDFRSAVFLSILLLGLYIMHAGVTLGLDYCVFCLAGYSAFFSLIGLVLIVQTASAWQMQMPRWKQILVTLLVVVLATGIGLGSFEQTGDRLFNLQIPRFLLGGPDPLGFSVLGEVLVNALQTEAQLLRRLLPAAAGLAAGMVALLIALALLGLMKRYKAAHPATNLPAYAVLALLVFWVGGIILAPIEALGGGFHNYDCGGDVIAGYDAAGAHLAKAIPAGSLVYWQGGLSIAPLLYVPGVRVFPPQMEDGYARYVIGDSDTLRRFGFWNQELAEQWIQEADYVLVEEQYYKKWLRATLEGGPYVELEASPPTVICRDDAQIRIFQRIWEQDGSGDTQP
jgi:hypothetical protein